MVLSAFLIQYKRLLDANADSENSQAKLPSQERSSARLMILFQYLTTAMKIVDWVTRSCPESTMTIVVKRIGIKKTR